MFAAIDARYPTAVQLEIPTEALGDCLCVLLVSGPQAVPQLSTPSRPSLEPHTAHTIHHPLQQKLHWKRGSPHDLSRVDIHVWA